jgi:radical SAM/Cys-rich protein
MGGKAMNDFEARIAETASVGLRSERVEILQVNLGLRCNQQCVHCHLGASPERTEMMPWATMELVLEASRKAGCRLVDLTGGAPELNPFFRGFVVALRRQGLPVQLRTNLTVLVEPGMEEMPGFLWENQVQLVASMPCYLEKNVRAQRGDGTYEKSVKAIRALNRLGYGVDPALPLRLVYNPGGAFLPPPQTALEEDYRRELGQRFGIRFSGLLAITNMPLGRFRNELDRKGERKGYFRLLRDAFNPKTVPGLMCRRHLSVGWDGRLYDCDFNLALGLPVNHGAPDHIRNFEPEELRLRRIVTGEHCFGCTAGAGSSCGGSLT